jgi:hypothetical protein
MAQPDISKPEPPRDRRRQTFLRLLAAGEPAIGAAEAANIPRSTLYIWRRDAPKFRAAWDRAAGLARDAIADRFQAALMQRALDGIDEPVFHAGRLVGHRKRYSDALLLAGLRELMKPAAPLSRAPANLPVRPRVIVEPLGPPTEEELQAMRRRPASEPAAPPRLAAPTPKPRPAPEPVAPEAETAPPPPDPDVPLRWDHLNRRDAPEPW